MSELFYRLLNLLEQRCDIQEYCTDGPTLPKNLIIYGTRIPMTSCVNMDSALMDALTDSPEK